jgi:hypothetical protein
MKVIGGLIGGLVGGAIGAGVWAGIAYGANLQIGWIALGVGILVGLGVAVGWREGGVGAGLLATVITIGSLLAGKYLTVTLLINKEAASIEEDAVASVNQESMLVSIADNVVRKREEAGETIEWPRGVTLETAQQESDYPPEIWTEARSRWDVMSAEERDELRDTLIALRLAFVDAMKGAAAKEGFVQSFSFIDAIFFLVAVATAFKIAESGAIGGHEV